MGKTYKDRRTMDHRMNDNNSRSKAMIMARIASTQMRENNIMTDVDDVDDVVDEYIGVKRLL